MSRFLPVAVAIGVLITAATRAAGADQTGYLYSYAVNDTRYADTVGAIDAYKPFGSPAAVVRPYFGFLASLDSRSTGGSVPQTYNDNYAVGALGLQYTTPSGLRVFIQGGVSTPLGSVAAVPSGGDLRYGVQLYREWTGGAHAPRYYGNFYGSAAFTSRYSDSELYNQLEVGRRVGRGQLGTQLYARGTLTLDTHGYFYANAAELALGVRFYPFGAHGPSLAIEQVGGTYLRGIPLPTGTSPSYTDFRPTVTFGMNI